MAYYLNLFTPQTWHAFQENGSRISGFRKAQRRFAKDRIQVGDVFVCYLVRLSRWCGALRITSDLYESNEPIFRNPDPFVFRFNVEPIVELDPEFAIPVKEERIWNELQLTENYEPGSSTWESFFAVRYANFQIPTGDSCLTSCNTNLMKVRNTH